MPPPAMDVRAASSALWIDFVSFHAIVGDGSIVSNINVNVTPARVTTRGQLPVVTSSPRKPPQTTTKTMIVPNWQATSNFRIRTLFDVRFRVAFVALEHIYNLLVKATRSQDDL